MSQGEELEDMPRDRDANCVRGHVKELSQFYVGFRALSQSLNNPILDLHFAGECIVVSDVHRLDCGGQLVERKSETKRIGKSCWDPAEVLRVLLAEEVVGRDLASKRIRTGAADFLSGKRLESWRPADSDIPKPTQQALITLGWVGRAENLVIWGPSGAGKSHLCEALAHAVIEVGKRAAWFSLESLTATVSGAKVDASIQKVVTRICRADLIVIDDIGTLPIGQDGAEAFYRVVDAADEKRSLAVTSNRHPAGFDTIMPKALATPAVDRLLHHTHLINTEVSSRRLAEAAAGRGEKTLT